MGEAGFPEATTNLILPLFASAGIVTVIWVGESTVNASVDTLPKVQLSPQNWMLLICPFCVPFAGKLLPSIWNVAPTRPELGFKPVIDAVVAPSPSVLWAACPVPTAAAGAASGVAPARSSRRAAASVAHASGASRGASPPPSPSAVSAEPSAADADCAAAVIAGASAATAAATTSGLAATPAAPPSSAATMPASAAETGGSPASITGEGRCGAPAGSGDPVSRG